MEIGRTERPLLILILGAQLLLAALFLSARHPGTAAALAGLPLDDAWIHLVYGRGLWETGRPEFNPGQIETGFTSPLQALIAALAHGISRLGPPVGLVLKLSSLLSALPATLLLHRLGRRLHGGGAGLAAAALLATSPTWTFAALSGMEVGLCGSLLLLAFLARLEERPTMAGISLALAFAARPEAALLAPLLLLGAPLRQAPRLLAPLLLLGLAQAGFNLHATGLPLPATFYAKQQGLDPHGLARAGAILARAWPVHGAGLGLLALLPGLLVLRAARGAGLALVLAPLVWIAAVASTRNIGVDDRIFYFLRYLLPVEPLALLPIGLGLARLALGRRRLLLPVCLGLGLILQLRGLEDRRALYAWNCQNIEEMQGGAADWLRDHASPNDRVASVDAGRIRYASGLPLIDLAGLNHHRLLQDPALRAAILTDPARAAAWMDAEGVQWIYLFPVDFPVAWPENEPQRFFEVAWRFEADPYTVAGPTQSVVFLLRRREP